MPDLSTKYLDLNLKNPLVASASPLSKKVDSVRRLEDAGASAVVMYSLFEEQLNYESQELDHYLTRGAESFAEALTYLPDIGDYNLGPDGYLEHIRKLKAAVDIPIIASLNGVATGGWVDHARQVQEAGADALELNIYYLPVDPNVSSAELEAVYVQLVRDVRERMSIPLALKLSPFFTALPNMARRFAEAGADGLVLFNRFYQPDFDLKHLEVVPSLHLSNSDDLQLPLRWIALLYGRVNVDFALTSGVHTAQDVIKSMMAGAKVSMLAAELLQRGVGRLTEILNDVQEWLEVNEYESIEQMQGSMSQIHSAQPEAFERSNYLRALNSFQIDPALIR